MTTERQSFVMPRESRFSLNCDRNQLPFILDNLGMRADLNNQHLVTPTQGTFLIRSIKDDLGIPREIVLQVRWFETGSVFSQAKDPWGNMIFNIELGRKKTVFQVSFDQRTLRFLSLYSDNYPIGFQKIKDLL